MKDGFSEFTVSPDAIYNDSREKMMSIVVSPKRYIQEAILIVSREPHS